MGQICRRQIINTLIFALLPGCSSILKRAPVDLCTNPKQIKFMVGYPTAVKKGISIDEVGPRQDYIKYFSDSLNDLGMKSISKGETVISGEFKKNYYTATDGETRFRPEIHVYGSSSNESIILLTCYSDQCEELKNPLTNEAISKTSAYLKPEVQYLYGPVDTPLKQSWNIENSLIEDINFTFDPNKYYFDRTSFFAKSIKYRSILEYLEKNNPDIPKEKWAYYLKNLSNFDLKNLSDKDADAYEDCSYSAHYNEIAMEDEASISGSKKCNERSKEITYVNNVIRPKILEAAKNWELLEAGSKITKNGWVLTESRIDLVNICKLRKPNADLYVQ